MAAGYDMLTSRTSMTSTSTGTLFEEVEEDENTIPEKIVFQCKNVHHPEGAKNRHHSALKGFKVTEKYEKIIKGKLKKWNNMSKNESKLFDEVETTLNEEVNKTNYNAFFKYVLWLEETAAISELQRYNMFNVNIKCYGRNLIQINVPGLAEKRPSVLQGDYISIRMHNDHTAYQGVVDQVLDSSILVRYLNEEILLLLRDCPKLLWDVKFEYSRVQVVRMHEGVEVVAKKMLKTLFPEKPPTEIKKKIWISNSNLINSELNQEQLMAVNNIVNRSSQHAPYIVFGPPGTGKTITIVEAILQMLKFNPDKNILVCAPSNAACDNLALKLYNFCKTKDELIRIHAESRDKSLIPTEIIPCSNLEQGEFFSINAKKLKKYRIIISTLHLIGKFRGEFRPHFLFIDEAAQSTEPDCDIAISLMTPGSFIVLAGDPEQLGPVVQSKLAEKKGLGQSLLERLMYTNSLYKETSKGHYDENFITMLVKNYRSHPDILKLPSQFFYKNKLVPLGHGDNISNISISGKVNSSKQTNGRSVEFCGLLSLEERSGASPSYFNESEKQMVIKYVRVLMGLKKYDVKESDIGIITPYIRQVGKIKQALHSMNLHKIDVGSTESFQGSEKRIILISTVRAQNLLLEHDAKYKLGFVSNKRRFNVALTRAKSKLIIIGNPQVLSIDRHWLEYINFCKKLGSYSGVDCEKNSPIRSLSNNLSNMSLDNNSKTRRAKNKAKAL